MGVCWSCYWGWPKPVADIYNKALKALEGDEVPLHVIARIVWENENFSSAQWCLDNLGSLEEYGGDYSASELSIVRKSLEELASLPEDIYDVEPENYDDKHPENYPPPEEVEMVRVAK